MATPHAPAVYATDVRKLSFGECLRFGGGFGKGCFFWVLSRFVGPQGESEMPVSYDEVEASPEELRDHFETAHAAWRRQFLELGYRLVGCQRIRKSKDPNHVDAGSVIYLSADGRLVGTLNLVITADPAQPGGLRVTEGCSVMFYRTQGGSASVTNLAVYLDPPPGGTAVFLKGARLAALHTRALAMVDREGPAIRSFGGWRDLRPVMEEEDIKSFLHRRDVRGLFVAK